MITFATIHNYNISHTPFYFVLFVDEMTHKYINMYLHINYESKFIYKYKIISHWEITIMKMLSNTPTGYKAIHKFIYEGICLYFKL